MTFINKIPEWLRWVLFLPVALIAALIVMIPFGLVALLVKHISPYEEITLLTRYLVDIVGYFLQGYVFVWLGAVIAPSKKFRVSIILFVIAIIICYGAAYKDYLYNQETRNTFYISQVIIRACALEIIGATAACYYTWRRYSKNKNEVLTSR